jgi:hypothetical protein
MRRGFGLTRVERCGKIMRMRSRSKGFVADGVQRNAFKVDGQYRNLVMMALLFES